MAIQKQQIKYLDMTSCYVALGLSNQTIYPMVPPENLLTKKTNQCSGFFPDRETNSMFCHWSVTGHFNIVSVSFVITSLLY